MTTLNANALIWYNISEINVIYGERGCIYSKRGMISFSINSTLSKILGLNVLAAATTIFLFGLA